MRLNVYLQKAGVGSRREAERLIADNRVAVNGVIAAATVPVEAGDVVTVDGTPVAPDERAPRRLFALNKPVDVICTTRDHENRRTIFELNALQDPRLPRLMNVGRLDINSEGLLLMSSDGPLAQALMSPAIGLPRVYRVRVRGRLTAQALRELEYGVEIDGFYYRGAHFEEERVEDGKANSWYRVEIYEGKNREIRRLMEFYGCLVNRLIRISYGPIHLGDLKAGEMREVPQPILHDLIDDLNRRGASL